MSRPPESIHECLFENARWKIMQSQKLEMKQKLWVAASCTLAESQKFPKDLRIAVVSCWEVLICVRATVLVQGEDENGVSCTGGCSPVFGKLNRLWVTVLFRERWPSAVLANRRRTTQLAWGELCGVETSYFCFVLWHFSSLCRQR